MKSHRTYNKTPEVSPKSIKWQQQAQPLVKWNKQHIDACLTIAEVAMEWIVELGVGGLDKGRRDLDAYLASSDIVIVQRNEAAG
jgi:hypothetical protein